MTRNRVTLRDVARRVGVHSSTVSRVLNPETRDMVSERIAQKVLKAVEEMGYRTNPFAYSLKMQRSLTIGVLIPDLTNPIFPPIIRGIEHVLGESGYTAILANTDNDLEQERMILETMKARQIDGLILGTAQRTDQIIDDCLKEGIPLVLINRSVDHDRVVSVVNDDWNGIAMAVEHIAALGHRQIAHVAGPQQISTGYVRHQAFLDAMAQRDLAVDPDLIAFADAFSEDAGCHALLSLLERRKPFTAVITANDLIALGCYDALKERGLACPEDVSVTGFNDMPFTDKFEPPLTTVRIRLFDMGAEAARILLDRIQGPEAKLSSRTLSCELIVRGSTAPPPKYRQAAE